jgi:hypothetical protein
MYCVQTGEQCETVSICLKNDMCLKNRAAKKNSWNHDHMLNKPLHPWQRNILESVSSAFRKPDTDPMENSERVTKLVITLKTFGTDAQREASIERLKKEIALQGFDATVHVIKQ